MNEEWKRIDGFPDYEVSNLGRVKSHRRGFPCIMRGGPGTGPMKYLRVTLRGVEGTKVVNIHRLVAEAFIPNPENKEWVLHRDGNVNRCCQENLYWGDPKANSNDRIEHGKSGKQDENPNSRLTSDQVAEIRRRYIPGIVKQTELAEEFGIRQAHVSRIVRGTSWQYEGEVA